MSSRNRQQEVLDHLAGSYEVAYQDPKSGLASISFWLAKPMNSAQVPLDGLVVHAILGNEKRVIVPERLDTHTLAKRPGVCEPRLGMRIQIDALPKGWIGECEFSFGRSYRCFPFKGIPDISGSLRPESMRPPPATLQEAAAP